MESITLKDFMDYRHTLEHEVFNGHFSGEHKVLLSVLRHIGCAKKTKQKAGEEKDEEEEDSTSSVTPTCDVAHL